MVCLLLRLLLLGSGASAVVVEQFGMTQCPMTSTWFSAFYDSCLKDKPHMLNAVNFTQYYVGGKRGGPVTEQTWNSSFHGYGEVTGAIYQLCARKLDTTAHKTKWLKFESCVNGAFEGVLGIASIPKNSARCAKEAGLDFIGLHQCATLPVRSVGSEGLDMFKASVFYTSDHNISYDTLIPGSGKLENIPVVHIDGRPYTGFDAYGDLTARLCANDPATMCGCDEGAMARGRAAAEALARGGPGARGEGPPRRPPPLPSMKTEDDDAGVELSAHECTASSDCESGHYCCCSDHDEGEFRSCDPCIECCSDQNDISGTGSCPMWCHCEV